MNNPTTDNQNAADGSLRSQISKTVEGIAAGYVGEDGIDHIMQLITDTVEQVIGQDELDSTKSDEWNMYRNDLRFKQRQTLQRITGRTE